MKSNTFGGLMMVVVLSAILLAGCGTTSTSKGASLGAVVGGLSDGWGGAAAGALVGGGVGYLVDRADDKAAARDEAERREAALATAASQLIRRRPTGHPISTRSLVQPGGQSASLVMIFLPVDMVRL